MQEAKKRPLKSSGAQRRKTRADAAGPPSKSGGDLNTCIFENVSDAIIVLDADTGRIWDCNRRLEEVTGFDKSEIKGRKLKKLLPEEDYSTFLVESGHDRAGRTARNISGIRLKTKGDSCVPVIMDVMPAVRDGRSCVLVLFHDLSERARIVRTLEKSERKYRDLLDNAMVGFYKTDLYGNILYVNEALARICEFDSREHMMSRNVLQIYKNDSDRDMLLKRLKSEGKVNDFETSIRTARGRTKIISLSASLENDLLSGMIVDVTERRLAEKESERRRERLSSFRKNEAIARLAGGVAHDFNNLLTGIRGNAELALRAVRSEGPAVNYLKAVERAGQRASVLTRQLLLYSGKHVHKMEIVDLGERAKEMARMLERLLGEGIELVLEHDPDLYEVHCDAEEIEMALVNLTINAKEAMPYGGRITIRIRNATLGREEAVSMSEARSGDFVKLEVEDEGTGIDPAILPDIFDPYFTTKEMGKGTGLGLSEVYGIVKQHNGWIDVKSRKGKGSVFTLYIPAVSGSEGATGRKRGAVEENRGRGERILLVEPDEYLGGFAAEALRLEGYHVFVAADFDEAREVFEREPGAWALVVADAYLPDVKACDLVEWFRGKTDAVGFILTGCPSQDDDPGKQPEEGVKCLSKPFSLDGFLEAVKEALWTREASKRS
jgi:PAS domain S-box-containing protein